MKDCTVGLGSRKRMEGDASRDTVHFFARIGANSVRLDTLVLSRVKMKAHVANVDRR